MGQEDLSDQKIFIRWVLFNHECTLETSPASSCPRGKPVADGGGLGEETTDEEISKYFNQFGTVLEVCMKIVCMRICVHSAPSIIFSHLIGAAVIPSEDRGEKGMRFRLV